MHDYFETLNEDDILSFEPCIQQPALCRAWQKFVDTGEITDNSVPAHIAASWKDSRRLKVDHRLPSSTHLLSADELDARRKANADLIDIAYPIAESIYESLEQTRYLVVLYDPDGYHLFRIGARSDLTRSSEYKIQEGLCFDERYVGTCGFSLVKKLMQPIQIVGCEHYSAWLHYVTGAYAPIISRTDGKLMGVIGVTGAKTPPIAHTKGIVIGASNAIGKMFEIQRTKNQLHLYIQALKATLDTFDDGVFYLTATGQILGMNLTAKKIFSISDDTNLKSHISKIPQFKSICPIVMHALRNPSSEKAETQCPINDQMYVVVLKNYQNNSGKKGGLVVELRNLKKLSQIVRKHTTDGPVFTFDTIVGSSKVIMEVKKLAMAAAQSSSTVIIEGESGTGKEVIAQAIHNDSSRKEKPFIALNCAAIPTELFETTMFGHEKGAFTGAVKTQIGKFELADGGTLFLDEIGDMPLLMQAKILRAIEHNVIEKIGSKRGITVDVRILAATNKDLYELVKTKNFREDLFYRLNVYRIINPPLRDRGEDIIKLAYHFAEKFSPIFQKRISRISDSCRDLLLNYNWPGNIRELKNAINFSMALVESDVLLPEHFKGFFRDFEPSPSPRLVVPEISGKLDHIEKNAILQALMACQWNKAKAAKMLGIGRATLYRKLKTMS